MAQSKLNVSTGNVSYTPLPRDVNMLRASGITTPMREAGASTRFDAYSHHQHNKQVNGDGKKKFSKQIMGSARKVGPGSLSPAQSRRSLYPTVR